MRTTLTFPGVVMIELRILGSPELIGANEDQAVPVLNRPRRLALLSYLAVESTGTYQRRDKLLGLFWPESTERKARSSLSEALSRLRQALGSDAIVTRGKEEIGLSAEHFWCDAAALLAASSDGKLNEVARLYRGPLLDGFFLDDSGGFDHWLESTRGHMERTALEALGRLTDGATASEDPSGVVWAERAVALSPLDGPSVRRLMAAQARSGHRAQALDLFERHKRRLMDDRGLEPSKEMVDLATRIETGDDFERSPAVGPRVLVPSITTSADTQQSPSRPDSAGVPDARDLVSALPVPGITSEDHPGLLNERAAGVP